MHSDQEGCTVFFSLILSRQFNSPSMLITPFAMSDNGGDGGNGAKGLKSASNAFNCMRGPGYGGNGGNGGNGGQGGKGGSGGVISIFLSVVSE